MATKANLVIDQGTTYSTSITITDEYNDIYDLTGFTGAAQLRKHYTSSNATAFSVALGGNTGVITLSLTSTQTASLIAGRYVYDVEITSSANVISRIVEGIATVTPNVTR